MFLCVIAILDCNIVDNIIWDLTSGIRAKVSVEVITEEEGKGLGIEKFVGTNFAY